MKTAFAKNLRIVRSAKGWTQEEASEIIGIKRSVLGSYEECRAEPSFEILISIANAYDIYDLYRFINDDNFLNNQTPKYPVSLIETKYRLLTGPVKKAVNVLLGLVE